MARLGLRYLALYSAATGVAQAPFLGQVKTAGEVAIAFHTIIAKVLDFATALFAEHNVYVAVVG